MATIGTFASNSNPLFQTSRIIAPPKPPPSTIVSPVNTGQSRVSPAPMSSSPTLPPPTTTLNRVLLSTFAPPAPIGGPQPSPSGATIISAPAATGSATGTQTGSTGTTDTSRLFDLVSAAFKPQDIGQTYGPQSVSDTATQASGGTNPMAIVILAIIVMAGVFLYAHKKKKVA